MKNAYAITVAVLFAPLFAGVGFEIAFYVEHPNDFMKLWAEGKAGQMLLPNFYITPISYAATLLLGLPAYLLLTKFQLNRFYHVVATGAFLGLVVHALLGSGMGRLYSGSNPLAMILPAMIVAGCFSLIVHLFSDRNEDGKQPDLD